MRGRGGGTEVARVRIWLSGSASSMSTRLISLKRPRKYPTKLALDIIRDIIEKKGPIENKQLWAVSQQIKPTAEELEHDRLESERESDISQLTVPGWVPPDKPPVKEKAPPGLSRAAQKRHRKEQAKLAKQKKLDNGHPVKSVTCALIIFSIFLLSWG
jgi:hypothetical protein